MVTQPTRVETGFVAVSLPKGTAVEGVGFRVPLPPEVSNAALPVAGPQIELRAIVSGRAVPLPAWLRYSNEEQVFVAAAVPDGGLPITVEIVVAGQRTLMVISERSN